MNEKQPPPKLENIVAAIKFRREPAPMGRSQIVASLNVGSAAWISDAEAKRHPEAVEYLKEKLKLHLLRQLYHDQRSEIGDAVEAFMRGWTPIPGGTLHDSMEIRDRLMKLANYTPPAGFDDDEFDCDRGANCGCEQLEFLLTSRTK